MADDANVWKQPFHRSKSPDIEAELSRRFADGDGFKWEPHELEEELHRRSVRESSDKIARAATIQAITAAIIAGATIANLVIFFCG